jgi:hypothetical protein
MKGTMKRIQIYDSAIIRLRFGLTAEPEGPMGGGGGGV